MSIHIKEVTNNVAQKDFITLPFRLYKDNPYWVPPLKTGELKMLMPEHNPAFEFCDAKFWLAEKNGSVVGRIGAIIHALSNEKMDERMGRFTRFESVDDEEVVNSLFDVAETWIRSKNMAGIHGPLGFSNLDHQGVLVEGFDQIPSMASEYHHEYYYRHFERLGYQKEEDWLEFRITLPDVVPDKVKRVSEIVKQRNGFQIINFKTKKEIAAYTDKVFAIFNKAFDGLFSTFQFNDKMMKFILDKFMPILNPKYVKLVLSREGEVGGFVISAPSLSKALQKAKGKLFPFGFIHLTRAINHPVEADLLLTGVLPEYLNQGLLALLMSELYQTYIDNGVKWIETTGMQESNHIAIQTWKSWDDHIQHKRKRCYRKMFS
jgi:GNAT superfamily N-acetyltransferase